MHADSCALNSSEYVPWVCVRLFVVSVCEDDVGFKCGRTLNWASFSCVHTESNTKVMADGHSRLGQVLCQSAADVSQLCPALSLAEASITWKLRTVCDMWHWLSIVFGQCESLSVEKSFLYHCTSSQELLEPQTTSTTAFAWILVEINLQVWHWGPCLVFMCIILYNGNFPTHFRVSGGRRTHLLWVLGLDLDAHQLKLESVSTTNVTCNTFHIRVLFIYINIDQKSE